MFVHYRTKAIVLKKVDRKEADQLFTLYTEDFGKLTVLGRAIRKISSKLRSGIEIFYLSEIEFIQGKAYKILTDAILIEKFDNIRKDLRKLTIAIKITEALDNLIQDRESDERVWSLLLGVFKKLNNINFEIKNLKLIYHYFFWNLLSILGYKPELYQCSICQEKLKPEKLYFSKKEGGVICQKCFLKESLAKEITPDAVKVIRVILDKNNKNVLKLKIEDKHLKLLEKISKDYL
jgi:DNA repair protein RecO (recombination protein O)